MTKVIDFLARGSSTALLLGQVSCAQRKGEVEGETPLARGQKSINKYKTLDTSFKSSFWEVAMVKILYFCVTGLLG